ncbi:MAG TPA: EamA family transporter [Acidimicrobiia bacterium]|nr:EamA family transporter [Acidimicrobiia bacterium]
MDRRSVWLLLGAAVLWGTTGTAQALGDAEGSALAVGAMRLGIGAAGLLAIGGRSISRPPLVWLVVGGAAMAGYQVAFFSAVARAGVALGTVVAIGSAPIMAGLMARVIRGERLSPRWWTSTALGVAGVALIAGRPDAADPLGISLALAAGFAYALGTLASKPLVEAMSPAAAMAAVFGTAALILAPLLPTADLEWLSRPAGLGAALWLGLGATTLAYLLFARGLRRSGVGQAATMGLAEPATAALLGSLLLGERPPALAWAGLASITAGLIILSWRR